ncbi:hypothetical protein [Ruegeria sp. HKCCD4318-2]|uniref:hypothetical protein n=1 Tax=Ruegeria sp. HKCCD4318-2 TaxID=2683020 RepID=UPI001C0F6F16|nr:hypothetical protein [Ruegeria sp. HKCCD4318-2]
MIPDRTLISVGIEKIEKPLKPTYSCPRNTPPVWRSRRPQNTLRAYIVLDDWATKGQAMHFGMIEYASSS